MSRISSLSELSGTISLQDEEKVLQKLKDEGFYSSEHLFPIPSLHFELTSHCNMYCKHCYNNSGSNTCSDEMTVNEWKKFAKYLSDRGGILECILSGGEPLLLGDGIFEIMDILHEKGTVFYLISNGYLFTDEIAQRLKKYRYHRIQISIDGVTAEYHDMFRQRNGSWEKAINATRILSKNNIPFKIAHCVTPYNLYDIDNMCELAHSLGTNYIMIGELCFSGRAADNQEFLLSPEQREYLFDKIKENRAKYRKIMQIKCSHSVKDGLERHKKTPNSCAIIRPNGDIRIDGMAPFVIGNVLKDDFEDIWVHKLHKAWNNPQVLKFISDFGSDDRNHSYINYLQKDIYI